MNFLKKLRWGDYALLLLLAIVLVIVYFRIDHTLNYKWNWSIIPNYILRWHEAEGRWVPNLLLEGLITTIRVSLYSSVLALILGIVLGLARCSHNLTVRLLARTYLEIFRNIPPVVLIFVFYFFFSEQIIAALEVERWARGIARSENNAIYTFLFGEMRRFPSLISGICVLALFESAFVGEIIRSGIKSVPNGQYEAAESIGMRTFYTLRLVIMPQAMRKVVPPLANQFITLVKDSSIISLIAVQELTYKATELVASTRAIFETWITTAVMYFLICYILSLLFSRVEKKLSLNKNT